MVPARTADVSVATNRVLFASPHQVNKQLPARRTRTTGPAHGSGAMRSAAAPDGLQPTGRLHGVDEATAQDLFSFSAPWPETKAALQSARTTRTASAARRASESPRFSLPAPTRRPT